MPKDPVLSAKSLSILINSLFSAMWRLLEFECGLEGGSKMIESATVTRGGGANKRK